MGNELNCLEVIELFPCHQQMYSISKGDKFILRLTLFDVNPARYYVEMCISDTDGNLKPFAKCILHNEQFISDEITYVNTKESFQIVVGSKFDLNEKFERIAS